MKTLFHISVIALALTLGVRIDLAQDSSKGAEKDPFDQKVTVVELRDETIFDAIGRLNQSYDVAISIEGILPDQGVVTNPKFRGEIENRTLGEALTWLCTLDGRYTWTRDGTMANLFPTKFRDDPHYFFNRSLPILKFQDARQSGEAAIDVVHQLGDPAEHLIFLGIGGTQAFPKPWTATFNDITVRQALNRIAQQLGPTCGWQIGGTTNARLIMFHYKLGAHAFAASPN
jgi:hypothetical protein